jgi:hypothetical protein
VLTQTDCVWRSARIGGGASAAASAVTSAAVLGHADQDAVGAGDGDWSEGSGVGKCARPVVRHGRHRAVVVEFFDPLHQPEPRARRVFEAPDLANGGAAGQHCDQTLPVYERWFHRAIGHHEPARDVSAGA